MPSPTAENAASDRLAVGGKLTTNGLEIADQLALLGIHGDHRWCA